MINVGRFKDAGDLMVYPRNKPMNQINQLSDLFDR
jgi:hypothetical protein